MPCRPVVAHNVFRAVEVGRDRGELDCSIQSPEPGPSWLPDRRSEECEYFNEPRLTFAGSLATQKVRGAAAQCWQATPQRSLRRLPLQVIT